MSLTVNELVTKLQSLNLPDVHVGYQVAHFLTPVENVEVKTSDGVTTVVLTSF
jgi:hypothetical protein